MSEFVSRCVIHGIDFHFDPGDALPQGVPTALRDVRAIVIEDDEIPANAAAIASYEASGAAVYRMRRANAANVPNATLSWNGENTFEAISFDADLTLDHPRFFQRMNQRPDDRLIRALGENILSSENWRWYDATRYQWEAMLDGYEVLRDVRYLETAQRQIRSAIDTQPNDLSNCDTVAPLIPILRLYEITRETRLLEYASTTFDRYLEITPTFRGCLVNFGVYARTVRSEILWQVLPGLMLLSRITANPRYARFAWQEYQRLHTLLFDPQRALWNHGVNRSETSKRFWARGVAFPILGESMLLEWADPTDDAAYALCLESFRRGVQTLAPLQDANGFWNCVVDQNDTQAESSGPAWMGAAIDCGLRLGFLPKSCRATADRAWHAVKSRIWQGGYPGHMSGTTISKDPGYYVKKLRNEAGWAHFAFRAACERMRRSSAER